MNAQQTISMAIANAEQFITKCKGISAQSKWMAVFEETMMAVGYKEGGGMTFTETPYGYDLANHFAERVTNGHGQHPVVMTHQEYLDKCIDMQENYLVTMRELQSKIN